MDHVLHPRGTHRLLRANLLHGDSDRYTSNAYRRRGPSIVLLKAFSTPACAAKYGMDGTLLCWRRSPAFGRPLLTSGLRLSASSVRTPGSNSIGPSCEIVRLTPHSSGITAGFAKRQRMADTIPPYSALGQRPESFLADWQHGVVH